MLNISSDLYKSSWINLVFKNRNQAYGAYQLRAQSSFITTKALFIVVPLFILLFAGPLLYKKLYPVQVQGDLPYETPVDLTRPPVNAKLPEKKNDLPKADPQKRN